MTVLVGYFVFCSLVENTASGKVVSLHQMTLKRQRFLDVAFIDRSK